MRTATKASPGPAQLPGKPVLLATAGLVLAVLLVYFQAIGFGFVKVDDTAYVTGNPRVLGGLTGSNIRWAFTTFEASNWHPLTWISLMADADLGGSAPRAYHLTNVLLHLASTLLLFHLLSRTTRSVWRSALVAALFAVHPLHVESVAWVAERKDVLSTFLWFLTIAAYLGYAKVPSASRYAAVAVLFALGLLAKPMLVTLPLTLLLLDYWPLRRIVLPLRARGRDLRPLSEKLPLLALSAASSVVTLAAQSSAAGTLEAVPLGVRLGNAAIAYATYLAKTVWPVGLSIHYPYAVPLPPARVAISLAVLAAITWLTARGAGRRPYLAMGWLWYLVTLVPVLGLVQVGEQGMADRYTYVPLIGIFVMLAWSLPDPGPPGAPAARGRVAALAGGAAIALGALAWAAHAQAGHWRSATDLFRHAVEVNGRNALARMGLAQELDEAGRHDEAIAEYREALRLRPSSWFAASNLAKGLARAGRTAEAVEAYRHLARLSPESAGVLGELAILLMQEGKLHEAESALLEAEKLKPDDAGIRAALGIVLTQEGKLDDAEARFREALRIDPGSATARKGLAALLARQGRLQETQALLP